MAPAELEVGVLSAYLSLPQQTLDSALDSPTTELVHSVLEAITAKAREHNELAADKLRADIELENAVRSSETRIEGLRVSLDKSQKTVEEVRTKLKEEGKCFTLNGMPFANLLLHRKRSVIPRERAPDLEILFQHVNIRGGNSPSANHIPRGC
jgi:predicted RNase H-like nuclease (RuvC/YqgF family)